VKRAKTFAGSQGSEFDKAVCALVRLERKLLAKARGNWVPCRSVYDKAQWHPRRRLHIGGVSAFVLHAHRPRPMFPENSRRNAPMQRRRFGIAALLGLGCLVVALGLAVRPVATQPTPGGTVTLTFDDYYIDDWHSMMPLFDQYNAKVTFFISNYAAFTAAEKAKLRELANVGHEIAAHTLTHADARCYPGNRLQCAKMDGERRAQAYVAEEILTELAMMAKDGFHPKNFAYPYGFDTPEATLLLKGLFDFVRGTQHKPVDKAFLDCSGDRFIGAMGMDVVYQISDADYDAAMDEAKSKHAHLVFYGHRIFPEPDHPQNKYFIGKDRLQSLLARIKERGLEFRRLQDVCGERSLP
jgi:peptidoglycan/xylan/chitin deacetylase (PgdA/CDA1 family)